MNTEATSSKPTACLALADGTLFYGRGFGATGTVTAELCFNTAMSGYQEILTDPASSGQIVTFTFPHIGNTGVNPEDSESESAGAAGMVLAQVPTAASNWRATADLGDWLATRGIVGIGGVDTRRLTNALRDGHARGAALAHDPAGAFDTGALVAAAKGAAGLEGQDLATQVTCPHSRTLPAEGAAPAGRVVVLDFGVRRSLLASLAGLGFEVTVVPATTTSAEVLALRPDGIVLSAGPGDPAATGARVASTIAELAGAGVPMLGIGLGHQLLALALGARTLRLSHGHHGANHPVRDLATGGVEATVMNHAFAVDAEGLPEALRATHVSLFDGSNCGIELAGQPVFSVQNLPASGAALAQEGNPLRRLQTAIAARRAA